LLLVVPVVLRSLGCDRWGWPCLLGQADVVEMTRNWTNNSTTFSQNVRQLLTVKQPAHLVGTLDQLQAGEQQRQQADASASGGLSTSEAAVVPGQPSVPGSRPQTASLSPASSQSSSLDDDEHDRISSRHRLVHNTFQQLFPEDFHAVVPVRTEAVEPKPAGLHTSQGNPAAVGQQEGICCRTAGSCWSPFIVDGCHSRSCLRYSGQWQRKQHCCCCCCCFRAQRGRACRK